MREALRVIEEYFRFIKNDSEISITFKSIRHSLVQVEMRFGREILLKNRDTVTDCFSDSNRPEELFRESKNDIVYAGFKRAQEAARVIEEYSKITSESSLSEKFKKVRFSLYKLEKQFWESENHG